MPTQLIDMDTLEGKPIEGAVALPIELLGDPCIRILLKKAIPGRPGLWSGQARLGKRWRQWHSDGLRRPSLEANMGDNLLSFVDGHIFKQQAHRSFALAHGGFGISPELTKTFWYLLDLGTLE